MLNHQGHVSNESFVASKRLIAKLQERYLLHNVSFVGEKAAADNEAAQNYISRLKDLIEEKEYALDQVFNCDETGLNWKKMPKHAFLTKEKKEVPVFKVAKETFTLLFCANASGFFWCKPILVYKCENTRAFKNKRKDHLPVFWKSQKNPWVTAPIFEQWFF